MAHNTAVQDLPVAEEQTKSSPKKLKCCVNGEWRDTSSGKYMPVYNSSSGEVMAEAPCCTAKEVEDAVAAAQSAFPEWSATPVGARAQLMFRYKAILDAHVDELATLLATEMSKNLQEARGDVLKAIEVVELACAVPVTMQGRSLMTVSKGHDTVTYREPIGVFAGIAPFNFPAMIPFGWMIPLRSPPATRLSSRQPAWFPRPASGCSNSCRKSACRTEWSTW